jgi:AcrR family transcriptional regulator
MSLTRTRVPSVDIPYSSVVPRLWDDTIEAHRRAVRDAVLQATAGLVAEHGLRAVTMSAIAQGTGIGRATLYKYFPDVDAILVAWHERQIAGHLQHLVQVRDHAGPRAIARLAAVLEAYALMANQHQTSELAAGLHRGPHVAGARRQLQEFIRELVADGAQRGELRGDVAPDELASYCLHALEAARTLPSKAAVRRLVSVVVCGLRPGD